MQNTIKASIIITTFNRSLLLERAIKSCSTQTMVNPYEIIVIDDNGYGSDNQHDTETLVQKYALKNLIYLPLQKNSGACVARNEGVKIASGNYIFFLDDDDEFLPEKLKIQTSFLDQHVEYDGCLSAFKRIEDCDKVILAESNFPVTGDFKNFVLNGNFFTPMLCIRKSSFEKTGGFRNISRFQDRFFMLHCLKQNFQFKDIRTELYIMYEHTGERVTHKSVEKSIESLDVIKKFIDGFKRDFSSAQYQKYILRDNKMRATIHYSARNRLKSFRLWLKVFSVSKNKKDLLMALKSFVN